MCRIYYLDIHAWGGAADPCLLGFRKSDVDKGRQRNLWVISTEAALETETGNKVLIRTSIFDANGHSIAFFHPSSLPTLQSIYVWMQLTSILKKTNISSKCFGFLL